ncbi:MAG: diaminopimelate dehydrogenase [Clostridia bacterium]|nr:diaminopimelate dehydrogenase [Clostridia bacterium]
MNIGIVGYGNVGKAVERIACLSKDIKLTGIFSRRNPATLVSPFDSVFYHQMELNDFKDKIDVLLLCQGSATDLVPLALETSKNFNTVDSFDNHGKMREYVVALDEVAREYGHFAIVGAGWDPGLFSLSRSLFEGVLGGESVTFWGKGVSQGHSEAIRRIEGVKMAVQYTIPKEYAVQLAYEGNGGGLASYERHKRVCYVVVDEKCDKKAVAEKIKNMPNYFSGYETEVYFVDEEEFITSHRTMSHGGRVIWAGNTWNHFANIELRLNAQSNPDFTASVLVAYAKCAHRLYKRGERGAKTILDIPMTALFDADRLDIIEKYL